jgi:hypothetical protein
MGFGNRLTIPSRIADDCDLSGDFCGSAFAEVRAREI